MKEQLDYLLARLEATDAKRHDPEHDLPHVHAADIIAATDGGRRTIEVHGASGTYEVSELRDEVARLAAIVRDIWEARP